MFESSVLTKVMADICKTKAFGYMVLDLGPRKHEDLRTRGNLMFDGEDTFIYARISE